MKINRVSLSYLEAGWFTKNVFRTIEITEAQGASRPELLTRKSYKTLKKIEDQVKSMADDMIRAEKANVATFDVFLSRKEKLIVRELVDNTVKMLEATIIPEYQRRSTTNAETYKDYLDEASMKVDLLKNLSRKFK